MTQPKFGQDGQALVAMLMVTALVAMIGASVMNVAHNMANEMEFAESKNGQILLRQDIGNAMQTALVCRHILSVEGVEGPVRLKWPLPPREVERKGVKVERAMDVLKSKVDLPTYRVRIDALELVNPVKVGPITPTRELFTATLQLKSSPLLTNTQYKPVSVAELYLEVEGGQMVDCYGRSDVKNVSKEVCTAIGATWIEGHCLLQPKFVRVMCPGNQYLQSFTIGGTKVCKDLPAGFTGRLPKPPKPPNQPTDPQGSGFLTTDEVIDQTFSNPGNYPYCESVYGRKPTPSGQINCTPIGSACVTGSGGGWGKLGLMTYRCEERK